MILFKERMTVEMLEEMEFLEQMAMAEIELCLSHIKACLAAKVVAAGATTASGLSVAAGARRNMDELVEYWVARMRPLRAFVDLEVWRAAIRQADIDAYIGLS